MKRKIKRLNVENSAFFHFISRKNVSKSLQGFITVWIYRLVFPFALHAQILVGCINTVQDDVVQFYKQQT